MAHQTDTTAEKKTQRAYYAATADRYDDMHVADDGEHARALAFFAGIAARHDHATVLDIGAGTGRGLRFIKAAMPDTRVTGIEPVAELREAATKDGVIRREEMQEGDATRLPFADDSFDWVIETGVLHHIKDFQAAVREMVRVARVGIMISDSNNMGQGSLPARLVKQAAKALGLWPAMIWAQTSGKGYKYSDGDGLYYSLCVFDCDPIVRTKFPVVHYVNTLPSGWNLYRTASHAAIIAYRDTVGRTPE